MVVGKGDGLALKCLENVERITTSIQSGLTGVKEDQKGEKQREYFNN